MVAILAKEQEARICDISTGDAGLTLFHDLPMTHDVIGVGLPCARPVITYALIKPKSGTMQNGAVI